MAINVRGLWALGKGGRNVHWWQYHEDTDDHRAMCNRSFRYSWAPGGTHKKCPKCMALLAKAVDQVTTP